MRHIAGLLRIGSATWSPTRRHQPILPAARRSDRELLRQLASRGTANRLKSGFGSDVERDRWVAPPIASISSHLPGGPSDMPTSSGQTTGLAFQCLSCTVRGR